jgi:hypothetical protein
MRRDLTCSTRSRVSRLTPVFIVAALAGLALSLSPVRPVQAATRTVCASGCDHTTIAAAIAAASAGDTISVTDAVHTEAGILVSKNLTIQGQGAASTTVNGGGSGPVFTVAGGGVIAAIQDMTISNGVTNGGGGGIRNFGTLTVSNSTLSGNSAPGGGGGISAGGTVNLKSTIVANSPSGGDCFHASGVFTAAGTNLDTDGTCAAWNPTHFTQVTPAFLKLGPLVLNAPGTTATHALLTGSVAIDAASDCLDSSGVPVTTDQRGVSRPQGPACDIGAYEISGPVVPPFPFPFPSPPPAASIPTLSEWAQFGVAVLLLGGGFWALRRRSVQTMRRHRPGS